MGVVGSLRQRQADLVLVDRLPEVLAGARRPVVVETAQVDVDFIQVPLLEVSAGAGRKQRNVQPTRSSETEEAKHAHLQQQGVDAHDPRLGDGRQEVVFYSEGQVLGADGCNSEEDVSLTATTSHLLLCGTMTNMMTSAVPMPNPATRTWTRSLPAQVHNEASVGRQQQANRLLA